MVGLPRAALPSRWLPRLDVLNHVAIGFVFGRIVLGHPSPGVSVLEGLLALTCVLGVRALVVPSSASRTALVGVLWTAAHAADEKESKVDPKQIARWIDQLGDENEAVREAAEKKLLENSEEALEQVLKAAKSHPDADVQLRARLLVKKLGKGRLLIGHVMPVRSIVVTKDGKTAFVALGPANRVAVVDVETTTVKDYILVGQRPWHMALSPDGAKLYVANGLTNDMTIVDVATLKPEKSVPVGRLPWGVVVKP